MKEKINIIKRKNGESQGVGALGAKPGFYSSLELYDNNNFISFQLKILGFPDEVSSTILESVPNAECLSDILREVE